MHAVPLFSQFTQGMLRMLAAAVNTLLEVALAVKITHVGLRERAQTSGELSEQNIAIKRLFSERKGAEEERARANSPRARAPWSKRHPTSYCRCVPRRGVESRGHRAQVAPFGQARSTRKQSKFTILL